MESISHQDQEDNGDGWHSDRWKQATNPAAPGHFDFALNADGGPGLIGVVEEAA